MVSQGFYNPYPPNNQQWYNDYAGQLLEGDLVEDVLAENLTQQKDRLGVVLQYIVNQRPHMLNLIEAYGISRRYSRAMTRRILRFTLNQPVLEQQEAGAVLERFILGDKKVLFILRLFQVPEAVIWRYIAGIMEIAWMNGRPHM